MASPLLQIVARQATSGVTPINSPAAHDVFKITGPTGALYSPPCKIIECNGRETIAQEQQAPGMTGAILVIRGTHLVSVTYEITLWDAGGFTSYAQLIKVLQAAQSARPQQSLKLVDLRLKDLRIPAVTPVLIPHQNLERTGLWSHRVKFTENAKLKIAGGPVQPARSAAERAQVAEMKSNNDKRLQVGDITQAQWANEAARLGKL